MDQTGTGSRIDPVLLPFLCTADEPQATEHLHDLIAQASPQIAKITRSSRSPEDAFQEAAHRLVRHLREMRLRRAGEAIGNYPHYVKVLASRVVKGQIREENPAHRSVVDSVRHLLKHDPSLAVWMQSGVRVCGLATWRDDGLRRMGSDRLRRLLDQPCSFEDVTPEDVRSAPAAILRKPGPIANLSNTALVCSLFAYIGHPIAFDELTRIVCGLRRVADTSRFIPFEGGPGGASERMPDKAWRPDEHAEWRQFLARLWAEIEQLPRLHRMAYLLNFTAGDGQLELFWIYGVASIRRMGQVLDIDVDEFARAWDILEVTPEWREHALACTKYHEHFALLWQALPLKDSQIAHMLGTERQKVINLRKAAGDRLSRNMSRARSRTRL